MSGKERELAIQMADGRVVACRLLFGQGSHDLMLVDPDGVTSTFSGQDYFDSLTALRLHFEAVGARVLCNGARIDAYPSAMSRSMGGGSRVYLTTLGQQGQPEDLVDSFDYAAPDTVGTVAQQERFHREWFDSLG